MRDALRGVDEAVDDLIALSAHYRRIRLGYLIGTGADLLFRLVRHFETAYPEITVEPREFDFSDPRPASPMAAPKSPSSGHQ